MTTISTVLASKRALWTVWVVAALMLLPVVGGWAYLAVVAASALLVSLVPGDNRGPSKRHDRRDLLAVGAIYVSVVALLRLAFAGFTTDRVAGLFLSFAAALLLGTAGPLFYTVWLRDRPLSWLGVRADNLRPTAVLALLFAGVQFALTLWGYGLPEAQDWVPLLCMALVVGVFESVFFRGFVQNVLEEQFGAVLGIGAAAVMYGGYHVGFGMGVSEMAFLTGLGIVYAVAFALARNLLVLWPLLTPLGSFFANVKAGEIDLPWAAIAGFADVLGLMAAAWWLARRHYRRRHAPVAEPARVRALP